MNKDGLVSTSPSATKTSPDQSCQRNNNYPKLSKEFYIELAAFSDSIYDRGKWFYLEILYRGSALTRFFSSTDFYLAVASLVVVPVVLRNHSIFQRV